jgi:hypothetical protein
MGTTSSEPGFIISRRDGRPYVEVIYDQVPGYLMNPNAFPPAQRFFVKACREHLTLLRHSASLVKDEIKGDAASLIRSLTFCGLPEMVHLTPHVFHTGGGYLTSLYATLSAAKSALDCFMMILVQLIEPGNKNEKLQGFHKGCEPDGTELSGRRIWVWMTTRGPDFDRRNDLANLIRDRSRDWITEAVKFRDDLIHRGRIKGYKGSRLDLTQGVETYGVGDVASPLMPSGVPVADYCDDLVGKTFGFIYDCTLLVPRVNKSLLANPLTSETPT